MGQALGQDQDTERGRGQGQEFQAAVLEIGEEQALERQQDRKQSGHPKDPRGDAQQNVGRRTDGEREQRGDQNEEQHHGAGIGALPQGQA